MTTQHVSELTYQNVIMRAPAPAHFSQEEIDSLRSERVLITGAGGSIGSRITSLLSTLGGITYLATDRDESALHSLSLKLTTSALFDSENFELLDIRDREGIAHCFERFKPTVVIHAAALKHLSALQKQPREAVLSNVIGTAHLIESSLTVGVRKFVNISTDKAAKPTSVLGTTKHLAELYTATFRKEHDLLYTNCRFGNVFNSRGSVIETFTRQMLLGAPITLTHPDITRFFMHTDEAAYLTLKSLLINAGDVHIFDMGEPVLMKQVIYKMQEILGTSSQILITGLRDGEKLHEDLYENVSDIMPSLNPKINILKFNQEIYAEFDAILPAIKAKDVKLMVDYLGGK